MKDISRTKNIFENIDNDLTLKNRRCCFTGHRFISNEHMDKIEKNLPIVIRTLAECGITEFLSGGALGFDMIAAKAVIREREKNGDIRLVLTLPCMNHTGVGKTQTRRILRASRRCRTKPYMYRMIIMTDVCCAVTVIWSIKAVTVYFIWHIRAAAPPIPLDMPLTQILKCII